MFIPTSLTGKTANLALLTFSVSVKVVWPLGFEAVRLYLFSSDVRLLLPSSDEDASAHKKTSTYIHQRDIHNISPSNEALISD